MLKVSKPAATQEPRVADRPRFGCYSYRFSYIEIAEGSSPHLDVYSYRSIVSLEEILAVFHQIVLSSFHRLLKAACYEHRPLGLGLGTRVVFLYPATPSSFLPSLDLLS
jgi:hypothetical protein